MALVRPLLVVAALLTLMPLGSRAGNLHPVVLVPGYGSNQLEAMLTAAYEPSAPAGAAAGAGGGWFQLWPNHTATRDASQVPCFVDQMSVVYDAGADDFRNADGVATRVPFFGSTRSLIGWDQLLRQLEGMGLPRRRDPLRGAVRLPLRRRAAGPPVRGGRPLLPRPGAPHPGEPPPQPGPPGRPGRPQLRLRAHVPVPPLPPAPLAPPLRASRRLPGLRARRVRGGDVRAQRRHGLRLAGRRAAHEDPAGAEPGERPVAPAHAAGVRGPGAGGDPERDLLGAQRVGVPRGDRVPRRGPAVRDAGASDVGGAAGADGAGDQRHRGRDQDAGDVRVRGGWLRGGTRGGVRRR